MSPALSSAAIPMATPEQVLRCIGNGEGLGECSGKATIIDLRSPGEFKDDHLPGAVNLPLFNDVERALIGTLYKKVSPDRAFDEGREVVFQRIGELFQEIARLSDWEMPEVDLGQRVREMTSQGIDALSETLRPAVLSELPERPVILHCWRGGMRSLSVVALLRLCGFNRAIGVIGGYKGYRKQVADEIARWGAPPAYVIRGYTGAGKTLVLRALEELRPDWTIDLELMAGHRSSILGMVGLEPVTQKHFETRVATRLRRLSALSPAGPLVYEGESRKIGDRILPTPIWDSLQGGTNILLHAKMERRIDVLIEDYLGKEANREALAEQLPFIERRLGPVKWRGALTGMLSAGADRELVKILLEDYYDPLYEHSEKGKNYVAQVEMHTPEQAAAEIATLIEARA
ncbi:MAG: tRNA 2-selenouridine(34) synthase MnmH [Planctomycetota bacterium]|nr:tRNA 2-selenouridine(34) synthase MnmH [Planctomycetota bacterium]